MSKEERFVDKDSSKNYELFYCRPNKKDFLINEPIPIIEYPIHHKHFRILSRIVLVKFGITENLDNIDFMDDLYDGHDSNNKSNLDDYSYSEELLNLESWETKILLFSSKLFFNELNKQEIEELSLDFDFIKVQCRDIWTSWVSPHISFDIGEISNESDFDDISLSIWDEKKDLIKKKFKLWKKFWIKVYYDREEKIFMYEDNEFGLGYKKCVGLDRQLFKK